MTRSQLVHGSCVALGPAGVLLVGSAGAGKSGLALQLMALGCDLVCDDRTALHVAGGNLIARCPSAIRGMIEARGVGILAADARDSAVVRLVVDLDRPETERLPPKREIELLECRIPLLHNPAIDHFPAAIIQYLRGDRTL